MGNAAQDSSFGADRDPVPQAQGQAALLLLESLIHALLDNGTLTKVQAIRAIDTALEVKRDSAVEAKEPPATLNKSLMLLNNMKRSLEAHSGRYDPVADADPRDGPADDQG